MPYPPEQPYQHVDHSRYAQDTQAGRVGDQRLYAHNVNPHASPAVAAPTPHYHGSLPDTRLAFSNELHNTPQHFDYSHQYAAPSHMHQQHQQYWPQVPFMTQQNLSQQHHPELRAPNWQQTQAYGHLQNSHAVQQHTTMAMHDASAVTHQNYHTSQAQFQPMAVPQYNGASSARPPQPSSNYLTHGRQSSDHNATQQAERTQSKHVQQLASRTSSSQLAEQSPNVYTATPQSLHQPSMKFQPAHTPSAKRRKSNEGLAVAVPQLKNASVVDQAMSSQKHGPSSSPLSELRSSQVQPPPRPDTDLSEVLLALADEYVHAAHSMSAGLHTSAATSDDVQHYNRLIATAISCLYSVLQNFRYPDQRKEARVRLRLANLLYEETEDFEQAEEVLSKGVAACEANRLYDLKYSMQHMFIRNLHAINARAASKALDKTLNEVETLGLRHWQYALGFLKVSLCMQSGKPSDTATSLKHLHGLAQLAHSEGCTGIRIICSCMQAVAHFRAGTRDDVDSAKQAIAEARSFQLSPEMSSMPQAQALLNCLQLIGQISEHSSEAMITAMRKMHQEQNTISKAPLWTKDGCFSLRTRVKTSRHAIADSQGIFTDAEGDLAINIRWLNSADMMILCYALSGIASLPKNGERSEAEKFLNQALKIGNISTIRTKTSLHALNNDIARKQDAEITTKCLLASALASRARYTDAQKLVQEIAAMPCTHSTTTETRIRLLGGICQQGLGNVEDALNIYNFDVAQLQQDSKERPLIRDVQILAGLNSVHIMLQLGHPGADTLLASLETFCLEHVNQNIASAWHLVVATSNYAGSTIIDMKDRLNKALTPAQTTRNQQLLAIIMNMMTDIFFTDIVGLQAKKSAHAAQAIAAKNGDPLWMAVGLGMNRDTLQRMGDSIKASEMNTLAEEAVSALPQDVKRILNLE